MKILIYEDNTIDLNSLLNCIDHFFTNNEIEYEVETCTDSNFVLTNHFKYDLIFFDIEVYEENSIALAYLVRKENQNIKIVFISNHPKYLKDGYKAQANRYFLKPINQAEFDFELKEVILDCIEEYEGFFDSEIYHLKIYYKNILYIEFINRKSNIHLKSGKILTTKYPLKYWIEKLTDYNFSQPYKSLLINLKHVSGFNEDGVILDNEEILPISRIFKKSFQEQHTLCLRRSM